MPDWIPPTIVLTYAGLVVLLAFVGAFGETRPRREAAYRILRLLLPWGLMVTLVAGREADRD